MFLRKLFKALFFISLNSSKCSFNLPLIISPFIKIREDVTFSKLDNLIRDKDIDKLTEYLDNLPNRFFKKRGDFYNYIGNELREEIKDKLYKSREKIENKFKISIVIDDTIFSSILEASKKLNIDRAKISYRLKSPYFKNYLFQNDELNKKFNKFLKIDPHISKKNLYP